MNAFQAALVSLPAAALGISFAVAGCRKPTPLPEQGTYAQQLYVERCGTSCHRPYNPASMTAAMWEMQVEAMRARMAQTGLPPLSSEQHLTILDYLKRNAGQH
jgi:hypothetical protein